MVKTCMAYGCAQKFIKGSDISFYSLPKDLERRRLWLVALRQKQLDVKPFHVLCSKHFKESDFNLERTGRRTLKPFAVPSVFENKPKRRKTKIIHRKKKEKTESKRAENTNTAHTYHLRERKTNKITEKLSDHTYSTTSISEKLKKEQVVQEINFKEQIDTLRKQFAASRKPENEQNLIDHTYSSKLDDSIQNSPIDNEEITPSFNDHAYTRLATGTSHVTKVRSSTVTSNRHNEHNYSISSTNKNRKRALSLKKGIGKRATTKNLSASHSYEITKNIPKLEGHVDHAYLSTNKSITRKTIQQDIPPERPINSEEPYFRNVAEQSNRIFENESVVDLRDHTYSLNDRKRPKSKESTNKVKNDSNEKLDTVVNRNSDAKLIFDQIVQQNVRNDCPVQKSRIINKNTDARLVLNALISMRNEPSGEVTKSNNSESVTLSPKMVKSSIPVRIKKVVKTRTEAATNDEIIITPTSPLPKRVLNIIENAREFIANIKPDNEVITSNRVRSTTKSATFIKTPTDVQDEQKQIEAKKIVSRLVTNTQKTNESSNKIETVLETNENTPVTPKPKIAVIQKSPPSLLKSVLQKSINIHFDREEKETNPKKVQTCNLPSTRLYPGPNRHVKKLRKNTGSINLEDIEVTDCLILTPIKRETITATEFNTIKETLTVLEPISDNLPVNPNLKYVLINPKEVKVDKAQLRMERATALFEEVFGKKPDDPDIEKTPSFDDMDICCAAQSDDILKRCAVRRRFAQPRYVGDYTSADMGCQRNAIRYYELSKTRMDSQKYIIKKLRTQNSRLSCRFRHLTSEILKMRTNMTVKNVER